MSGAVFLTVFWIVFPSRADPADVVDKSQYSIFNPVPDDLLRSFSTDRPTKSYSATTVDAGHFQYETDFSSWTLDRYGGASRRSSNFVIGDPTLKVGLTNTTDFELALAPLNIFTTSDKSNGRETTNIGFGDVFAKFKYTLLGDDHGDTALAIVPYVKIPTAAPPIGNKYWEGGAYAPLSITLPQEWTLAFTSEIDILENANLQGVHPNFQNLINIGHPLFSDKVTGYAEFWSDVDADNNAPDQFTFDLAIAWLIGNDLQLDAGVNVGLNKAAPDLQSYFGISQRF